MMVKGRGRSSEVCWKVRVSAAEGAPNYNSLQVGGGVRSFEAREEPRGA